MSITVGAALKKIAVALLSDKKTLKKAAMAILVVIVALFMPMAAIITVFSGTLKLVVGALQEQIAEEMSDGDRQMLQQVEDNMNAIQTALRDADMPSRVREAQMLYILALYDHSDQPGFVPRLVGCFQPEQTDDQLIAAVNNAFGTNIAAEDFTKLVGNVRSQYVDTSNYVYPTTKNNLDLVQWAISLGLCMGDLWAGADTGHAGGKGSAVSGQCGRLRGVHPQSLSGQAYCRLRGLYQGVLLVRPGNGFCELRHQWHAGYRR